MPLGDAYIEDPVRILSEHIPHRAPGDHCGGDTDDPLIYISEVYQSLPEYLLKLLRRPTLLALMSQLSGAEVEASRSVP